MFSAVGYIIELKSGKTWEQFVRERILAPLGMSSTTYTISEMVKHPDHGVPFREKRDSFELYKIPFYEDTEGVAPAGAIISNIEELSHWLIALMNDGKYNGKQVLPASVLKATLQPAIGLPNIKGLQFRTPQFSDSIYEFVMENGQVKALKERDPSGEYSFPRQ